MKTIITVQHTQSVHHTNGMVGSWTDWPLTELGQQQANCIGEKLSRELAGKAAVIYTSDLLRAKQTALAIGQCLGVEPICDRALRERNLGSACGKSVAWMHENQTAFEVTVDDRLLPDAESRREEWNRLTPFFEKIMACDADTVIIVSHGDLLSVFNAMFMGLDVENLNAFEAWGPSGGVSWMQINDGGKRFIRRLGDLSYIRN